MKELTKKQLFDLQFKYAQLIDIFGDKWWEDENMFFVLSTSTGLTDDFIRDFHNLLDWRMLSKYQTFSEDFIREFYISFKYTKFPIPRNHEEFHQVVNNAIERSKYKGDEIDKFLSEIIQQYRGG